MRKHSTVSGANENLKNALDPKRAHQVAFITEELSARGASHGVGHALTVRNLALGLWRSGLDDEFKPTVARAAADGLDAERVLELAALLHDVCDHKYVDAATEAGRAALARRDAFLAAHAPPADAAAALAIVAEVSYSRENKAAAAGKTPSWKDLDEPVKTLRHVVSDADKIDAIGSGGLRRCVEYRLELEPDIAAAACVADVAAHCDEKLLRLLPEFIKTDAGRAYAAPGHEWLCDWNSRARAFLATLSWANNTDALGALEGVASIGEIRG